MLQLKTPSPYFLNVSYVYDIVSVTSRKFSCIVYGREARVTVLTSSVKVGGSREMPGIADTGQLGGYGQLT